MSKTTYCIEDIVTHREAKFDNQQDRDNFSNKLENICYNKDIDFTSRFLVYNHIGVV